MAPAFARFSMLDRKALRDLWHLRGPAFAIALVVLAGVASFVSMRSMVPHLRSAQQRYYATARFADLWVRVTRAPAAVADDLRALPGVTAVETRAADDVILDVPGFGEPVSGRVIGYPGGRLPAVNRVVLRRGRFMAPGSDDEVVISEGFAQAHGLAPGDSLGGILNDRWRRLHIVGIGLTPEFVVETKPGELFPDSRRYGVLWLDAAAAAAALGLEGAWNEASLLLRPGTSERAVIARADTLLARYGGLGSFGRDLQPSHRFLSDEITQASVFATAAPVIFLGVAAFLVNLVLARLVASQREQIGMMKAFGVSTRALARHYALIALGPVAVGATAGTVFGLWLAGRLATVYAKYYRIPDAPFTPTWSVVVIAVAITGVAALLGAVQTVRRVVRLPAAESMRPESPVRYRAGLVERLGLTRHVSPMTRLTVRGIERRPLRAGLALLGMALSVAVTMIGLFAFDAISAMRDVQFRAAQREDLAVTFTRPQGDAALRELAQLPGVTQVEPTWAVPVRLRHAQYERRVAMTGVPPQAALRQVVNAHGAPAPLPGDGLLLSTELARLLRVQVGDTVAVDVLVGRRADGRLRVGALVDDLIGTNAYVPMGALRALVGDAAYDGAVLAVDAVALDRVYAHLKQAPGVAGLSSRAALIANFDKTMAESFNITLLTLAAFAGLLSVGVIYNTARIALSERGRELASLRVLGFTRREVARMLFGELTILGVVAVPAGFMIGAGFCWALAAALSSELFRLPLVLAMRTYALSALMLCVAGALSALLVRRRLDRLDLVAVLKTRE
ncbi:MAG: FtsX-like permease family protein [Gemmatimonas sp.]|jgi:putative ABC transport system permease protein|uniref:ABC transporter permease n=2 Tax=Gemmatimonas sp. TaxID=1962908 RepID=UPI00391F1DE6|nr:FtsX-like permease family protein [Gemmatimonadota bacterium]